MEGTARRELWMKLKQRLGLRATGFCGSSQSLRASNTHFREGGGGEEEAVISGGVGPIPAERSSVPPSVSQIPARPGMNLATALAAERNQRSAGPTRSAAVAPLKSLMRLFDETDGADEGGKNKRAEGEGIDAVCCVCIERNKGAAFIPCGHTFCRVCSIELWLSRASCPLCNRLINDILHLF